MKAILSGFGSRLEKIGVMTVLCLGAVALPLEAADGVTGWGSNSVGQIGDNTTLSRDTPGAADMTGALGGKKVIQVAAGGEHSLALTSDGRVYSWGANSSGQLGTGNNVNSKAPVAVRTDGALSGKTVIAISAGLAHSLALTSEGRVVAWGQNGDGQLGIDSIVNSNVPVQIVQSASLGRRSIVAIAAGGYHSVALANDGRIYAWGDNSMGQLGDSSFTPKRTAFSAYMDGALAGKSITAIAAGDNHTLALSSDQIVFSWGRNNEGQLGDWTNNNSNVPVPVSTENRVLRGVLAIDAGANHSVVRTMYSECAAWGANNNGQLGNGGTANSNVPVRVSQVLLQMGQVRSISAGGDYNLVYATDGTIYSWGANSYGQLGNDTNAGSNVPVRVIRSGILAGKVIESYSAGGAHSLAVASVPVAEPGTEQLILKDSSRAEPGIGSAFDIHVDTGGQVVFRSVVDSPAAVGGSIASGYVLRPDTTDPAIKYESGVANGKHWYQYTVIGAGSGAGYFHTTPQAGTPVGTMIQTLTVTNELHLQASSSTGNYPVGNSPTFRAVLTENGRPVLGAGITVRFDDPEVAPVGMFDDGQHNDVKANDGVYGVIAQPIKKGSYTATVVAFANNAAGEPFRRQSMFNFTVGADTIAPHVVVTTPANNAAVK